MPELPEVETVRRQLADRVDGRTVVDAWAFGSAKFTDATTIVGATIGSLRRRGKFLIAPLDGRPSDGVGRADPSAPPDRELIVHLGMTGHLSFAADDDESSPYRRATWWFDDGSVLRFDDVRRFGRVLVVPSGDYRRSPTLEHLGPEPFDDDFNGEHLHRAINRSRRMVKTLLLSQSVVAGVGNIYADEALWAAGVRPNRRSLGRERCQRLVEEIRAALAGGLARGGTTVRDYRSPDGRSGANQFHLRCYGRAGQPCLTCGSALRSVTLDSRTTTYCATCQT